MLSGQIKVVFTLTGLKVHPGKALLEGGVLKSFRNGAGDGTPQLIKATLYGGCGCGQ